MKPQHLASSLLAIGVLACALNAPATAQTKPCEVKDAQQLAGAYRLAKGGIVSIRPSGKEGHWRVTRFESGRSHQLHPAGDLQFQSASDWESEHPAVLRYAFGLGKDGLAQSLSITESGKPPETAGKIPLRERTGTFKSGPIDLFGKLTLPATGKPPFKTVVYVHGSDPVASVDREWLPHLLASNGIATLVFDKRGTGCSGGQYLQRFDALSDDVAAAASWLKTQPEVDLARIGLAGFSQGGWVAPLAALKEPSIRFVLIGYGLAMSMADEDRLEAPLKLRQKGLDEAAIAEYQELNAALHQLARDDFRDWREFEEKLDRFKGREWLSVAKGLQTWLGLALQMGVPQAKVVAPQMFESFFQPFYEPVPTLQTLTVPMLWLIAEQDIEAPPEPTIAALRKLRQHGKPFSTLIFPRTDHGMTEFQVRDGQRVRTKYANGYFSTLLKWIREQP